MCFVSINQSHALEKVYEIRYAPSGTRYNPIKSFGGMILIEGNREVVVDK